jgi:hypothetical protein
VLEEARAERLPEVEPMSLVVPVVPPAVVSVELPVVLLEPLVPPVAPIELPLVPPVAPLVLPDPDVLPVAAPVPLVPLRVLPGVVMLLVLPPLVAEPGPAEPLVLPAEVPVPLVPLLEPLVPPPVWATASEAAVANAASAVNVLRDRFILLSCRVEEDCFSTRLKHPSCGCAGAR